MSLDSFRGYPSQHSLQSGVALLSIASKRLVTRNDAKQNVGCSLLKSTRGTSRVKVRVLVARSHHHGEEEEEGCQEGRQEEEQGPRLTRWLIEFLRGLFQPGETEFRQPQRVLFRVQTRKAGPGPWAPGPA